MAAPPAAAAASVARDRATPRTPLEWRERLYTRRPATVRRHAALIASRTSLLFIGDVVALLLAREALHASVLRVAPGVAAQWELIGPLAAPGRPASTIFGITLLAALIVTSSYGRWPPFAAAARLAIAAAIAGVITAGALAAVAGVGVAVVQAAAVALTAWLALLVGRAIANWFIVNVWPRDRWAAAAVAVSDDVEVDGSIARALRAAAGEYRVTHVVAPSPGFHAAVREVVFEDDVEAIVLGDSATSSEARAALDVALGVGCQFLCPARALDTRGMHPRLLWVGGSAFLEVGPVVLQPGAVVAKRITDVLLSALLLAVAAPLMLLIAIGIKLDSRGPVLFAQHRAGLGGRRIRMLKFRTMHDGADGEKQHLAHLNHTGDARLFKIPSDPRVTRLGALLRRWSLDELPQLWNVLRGDMSLVGPRPFFESDFAAYEGHHFRRLDTKPGLTGLWQVSGRSDVVNFEDVIFLDRQYIERWSFWLDMLILLRTIPAVMQRKGAF
jgi:exopolysaccharide biosynthesis polyprenyl glycosylphosphotransferase